ncbi:MAG: RidA family protein [Planctomycetota bacterium]|jgi:reactive intermediate/imine deaminase
MKVIKTAGMPPSNGHYSMVMEHQGILYISGQLPRDPQSKQVPEGIEAQTALALKNLDLLLTESGSDRMHVLQARIYISDVEYWGPVNQVYAEFFGEHKPARCIVPSRELHFGCLVEIEAVACLPEG